MAKQNLYYIPVGKGNRILLLQVLLGKKLRGCGFTAQLYQIFKPNKIKFSYSFA